MGGGEAKLNDSGGLKRFPFKWRFLISFLLLELVLFLSASESRRMRTNARGRGGSREKGAGSKAAHGGSGGLPFALDLGA